MQPVVHPAGGGEPRRPDEVTREQRERRVVVPGSDGGENTGRP